MNEIEVREYLLRKADEFRRHLELSENKFAEQVLHIDKSVWSKMKSDNYSINSKHFKKLMDILGIDIEVSYKITENEINYDEMKRELEKSEIESEISRLQSRLKELSES